MGKKKHDSSIEAGFGFESKGAMFKEYAGRIALVSGWTVLGIGAVGVASAASVGAWHGTRYVDHKFDAAVPDEPDTEIDRCNGDEDSDIIAHINPAASDFDPSRSPAVLVDYAYTLAEDQLDGLLGTTQPGIGDVACRDRVDNGIFDGIKYETVLTDGGVALVTLMQEHSATAVPTD